MQPTLVRDDLRYWRLEPDPRLRPGVLCYFVAMPPPGGATGRRRADKELFLPDGYSELVFLLSDAFERWPVNRDQAATVMRRSYVIGGRSESVLTRALGEPVVAGAKLEPFHMRHLVRTPLSEFKDATLSLDDLNNRELLVLEDQLANARTAAQIKRLFDAYFLKAMGMQAAPDYYVETLLKDIRSHRGNLGLMQWMQQHQLDARNFERRFCRLTGMTPKSYARIVRFKRSYAQLLQGRGSLQHDHFYLDGYYDQSHFIREFRRFFGLTPTNALSKHSPIEVGIADHLLRKEAAHARRTSTAG